MAIDSSSSKAVGGRAAAAKMLQPELVRRLFSFLFVPIILASRSAIHADYRDSQQISNSSRVTVESLTHKFVCIGFRAGPFVLSSVQFTEICELYCLVHERRFGSYARPRSSPHEIDTETMVVFISVSSLFWRRCRFAWCLWCRVEILTDSGFINVTNVGDSSVAEMPSADLWNYWKGMSNIFRSSGLGWARSRLYRRFLYVQLYLIFQRFLRSCWWTHFRNRENHKSSVNNSDILFWKIQIFEEQFHVFRTCPDV